MLSTSETNQKKFYKIGNMESDKDAEDMDINLEEVDMVGGADAPKTPEEIEIEAEQAATKVGTFNTAISSRPLDSARYIPSIDREMVDVVPPPPPRTSPDASSPVKLIEVNDVVIRTYSIKFCLIEKTYTFSDLKEQLLINIEKEINKPEYTQDERGLVQLLCATKFMTNIDDVIWCIHKNNFHVKIETDPSKITSIEDIKFLYDIGVIDIPNLKKLIRELTDYKLLEETLLLLFNKSYNGKMLNPFDKSSKGLTDTEQLYAYKIHQFLHVVATETGSIVVTNQSTTSEEQAPIKEAVADICLKHRLDRRYSVLYFSYLSVSTLVRKSEVERSEIKNNIKIGSTSLLF
jgi:hypothetical protein